MKISAMREFLLLAANRNYSKTAEQLYMAQSALSRHIAAMEDELGVQLIQRTKNSFQLTEAGEIAAEGFEKILKQYQQTLNSIGALSSQVSGELRLGILYYDINDYVAVIRDAFHRCFPEVKLTLLSYQPEQQEQALLNGEIDAALSYVALPDNGAVSVFPFLKTSFLVLFNKEHRFAASEESLKVCELNGEKLLDVPTSYQICDTKRQISQMLEENQVSFVERIPVMNFDEVPMLLKETGAVYIAPMINPKVYQNTVGWRLLEPDRYSGGISVVWRNGDKNPLIRVLISAIKIAYS